MNKHKKPEQETKTAEQSTIEFMQQEHPELTVEEIEDYDRALDDFLNLCREFYWDRVKAGTFPWPDEDSTL